MRKTGPLNRFLTTIICIFTLASVSGCSFLEGLFDKIPVPKPTATATATATAIATPPPTPRPTPRPTPPPTPRPTPPSSFCPVSLRAEDGTGGFVMKNGDHTNRLVVLFPGRFKQQFSSVTIEQKNGNRASLIFAGWANPDSGGDRQHWRHNTLTVSNVKPGSMVLGKDSGGICSWQLPDPIRNNRVD
jgi:hypothetical protein